MNGVRKPFAGLVAVFAVALGPGVAQAGQATIVSRDVPLDGSRRLAAAAPGRFNLVGLHWKGTGTVAFRTHAVDGRWSRWRPAAPEQEDRPDRGSPERRGAAGWQIGNPYWTGTADRIEYRLGGKVRRLRAHFVWSPVETVPLRTTSVAGSPAVLPRLSWGASESMRRSSPRYAQSLRFAIVHHTAGTNAYSARQSAAIVRGIQLYHVKGNGWNDIGYNFLVDRFGQVFEGRYGGVTRNVVGAHAEGFNTGSVGVSLIGNYGATSISPQARAALVRLLAWRLDVAHINPVSTLTWISGGNARFPSGTPVFLRTVSGHRDTGFTSCPGDALYRLLGSLAGDVGRTGLPKLYTPRVRGRVGERVRFTGRLSTTLPWTVTVTNALGQRIARGAATSAGIDWTWDARVTPRGRYAYAMEAGPTVRPVRGVVGTTSITSPPPPPTNALLSGVTVSPPSVTPNGDGLNDTTTVRYSLTAAATVTATLVDATGRVVATLFSARREAGQRSFRLTADEVPDGMYTVVLTVTADDGRSATLSAPVVVSRLIRALAAAPTVFSPNGDGRFDRIRFTFELLGAATVSLRIDGAGFTVATPFTGVLEPGRHELRWDGRIPGTRLPDGRYDAVVTVTDAVASLSQTIPFSSDTTAPRLVARTGWRAWLSEPSSITVTSGPWKLVLRVPAGTVVVPRPHPDARSARVFAVDAVGNVSRTATVR